MFSPSPLIALPQEIINLVVANVIKNSEIDKTVQTMTNLALTCTYFLRLLARPLQARLTQASWAGDRLIFVGDYAEGYPPNIASEEEEKEWARKPDGRNANPLYFVTDKHMEEYKVDPNDEEETGGKRVGTEEAEKDFDPARLLGRHNLAEENDLRRCDILIKLLTSQPKPVDKTHSKPILRNLTAKKYVRDQALAESKPNYSLGDIIIALGLWTADGSGTRNLDVPGRWAGHRFDIATLADVDEVWEDASEMALDALRAMYDGPMQADGRRA